MKKRFLLLICLVLCMITLAACGEEADKPFAYDESEMTEVFEDLLGQLVQMTSDSDIELSKENGKNEFAVNAVTAWGNVKDELGEYVGIKETTVTNGTDSVTVKAVASFEERDCDISLVFEKSYGVISPTSMEFSAKYSLGETMLKALQNTIMGMGIVFLVLILISCIIALFKFIPKLLERPKKAEAATEVVTAQEPAAEESVDESDDLELIAVIAAAIAAYEGAATTDGFVVRSVKRRANNNWNKR